MAGLCPLAEMRQSEAFSRSPSAKTSLTQGAVIHLAVPTSKKFTSGAGAKSSTEHHWRTLRRTQSLVLCSHYHNAFEFVGGTPARDNASAAARCTSFCRVAGELFECTLSWNRLLTFREELCNVFIIIIRLRSCEMMWCMANKDLRAPIVVSPDWETGLAGSGCGVPDLVLRVTMTTVGLPFATTTQTRALPALLPAASR